MDLDGKDLDDAPVPEATNSIADPGVAKIRELCKWYLLSMRLYWPVLQSPNMLQYLPVSRYMRLHNHSRRARQ